MIKDLKELQTLLKLCRKQGVTEITLNGTTVKFGDLPAKRGEAEDDDDPPTEQLTPEQLMYFSVGGEPPA